MYMPRPMRPHQLRSPHTEDQFEELHARVREQDPRASVYLLGLHETGLRQYMLDRLAWGSHQEVTVSGLPVHLFRGQLTTNRRHDDGIVVFTERLWNAVRALGDEMVGRVFRTESAGLIRLRCRRAVRAATNSAPDLDFGALYALRFDWACRKLDEGHNELCISRAMGQRPLSALSRMVNSEIYPRLEDLVRVVDTARFGVRPGVGASNRAAAVIGGGHS
jgi:hypothetical protein